MCTGLSTGDDDDTGSLTLEGGFLGRGSAGAGLRGGPGGWGCVTGPGLTETLSLACCPRLSRILSQK